MRCARLALLVVVWSAPWCLAGDWQPIAPGIDYMEMTLEGPVKVYVARADRSRTNWVVDSMVPKGTARGAVETVPAMAQRYDDSIDAEGRRYEVKVAINGDYWNPKTNVPVGGQIVGGWFVRRFTEYGGGSGFIWAGDRRCVLGGTVRNGKALQRAVFADGEEMNITRLNDPRGPDELALYTYHYDASTGTTPDGVEVLVHMEGPLALLQPDVARGRVVRVRENAGDTSLPYEHVVLSARGAAARKLLAHAREGSEVRFDLRIEDYGIEESGLEPANWRNAYASIGAPKTIVAQGKVPHEWWEAKAARQIAAGGKSGAVVTDPRTFIAYNDKHLYFGVADGRWKQSVGFTFTQAGNFCVERLQATDAVLQDGGGSSTMYVDGRVRNNPSDFRTPEQPGKLRPVANGYMLALVHPPERSTQFAAGDQPGVTEGAEVRRGPGTHFAAGATLREGARARILPHRLNGVKAKGATWWNCSLNAGSAADAATGGIGWIREDQLRPADDGREK